MTKPYKTWRAIRANFLYEARRIKVLANNRFIYEYGDPGGGGRKSSYIPTFCEFCDWIGIEKEHIHTYTGDGCGDVEAIDKCPNCNAWEPRRLTTWRKSWVNFWKKIDSYLDPGYQETKTRKQKPL